MATILEITVGVTEVKEFTAWLEDRSDLNLIATSTNTWEYRVHNPDEHTDHKFGSKFLDSLGEISDFVSYLKGVNQMEEIEVETFQYNVPSFIDVDLFEYFENGE